MNLKNFKSLKIGQVQKYPLHPKAEVVRSDFLQRPLCEQDVFEYYNDPDIKRHIILQCGDRQVGLRFMITPRESVIFRTHPGSFEPIYIRNEEDFDYWNTGRLIEVVPASLETEIVGKIDYEGNPYFNWTRLCETAFITEKWLEKLDDVSKVVCKFSVVGNTPVLVKNVEKIELVEIEKVIQEVKKGKTLDVLSFNGKDPVFCRIVDFLEHNVPEIYQIYYEGTNVPIEITKDHSVFIWENGKILPKEGKDLTVNDLLVSPSEMSFLPEIPEEIKGFEGLSPIDLMKLAGAYLGNGFLIKHKIKRKGKKTTYYSIHFVVQKETTSFLQTVQTLKDIFGKLSIYTKLHSNTRSLQINLTTGKLPFKSIKKIYLFLLQFGKDERNKELPSWVWKLPSDLFLLLLDWYFKVTCGYEKTNGKKRIIIINKKLALQLLWNLKLRRVKAYLFKGTYRDSVIDDKKITKYKKIRSHLPVYYLSFFDKSISVEKECLKKYPVDLIHDFIKFNQVQNKFFPSIAQNLWDDNIKLATKETINSFLNQLCNDRDATIGKIEDLRNKYQKLFEISLDIVSIKKIKVIKKKARVFDISVEKYENFFGGFFPVLLHNSGSRGIHIFIVYKSQLPIDEIRNRLYFFLDEKIVKNPKVNWDKKLVWGPIGLDEVRVDLMVNIFPRGIKAAWSLDSNTGLISLPLPEEYLPTFEKPYASPLSTYWCEIVKRDDIILDIGTLPGLKEEATKRVGYFPKHPDLVLIAPNEWYPKKGLAEKHIWAYYDLMKDKILPFIKDRKILIRFKTSPTKELIIRHDPKTGEFIRIRDQDEYDRFNNGKNVSFYTEMDTLDEIVRVDLDPERRFPLRRTKEIAIIVCNLLEAHPFIDRVEAKFSGKRGFHLIGYFKKGITTEDLNREIKKLWKEVKEPEKIPSYIEKRG